MITVTDIRYISSGAYYVEFAGLSSDAKPEGEFGGLKLYNGSCFVEMDTGEIYMYDVDNAKWIKFGGGEE